MLKRWRVVETPRMAYTTDYLDLIKNILRFTKRPSDSGKCTFSRSNSLVSLCLLYLTLAHCITLYDLVEFISLENDKKISMVTSV